MSKYPSIGNGAADSRRHSMARYWSPNQRRIRVEVVHRAYQPRRQHSTVPPWLIALLILVAVMWISPFGAVVALVMISIFLTAHPTIAIAIGGTIALVIAIGLHQRWRGHPF
jgi:hypothetical protein